MPLGRWQVLVGRCRRVTLDGVRRAELGRLLLVVLWLLRLLVLRLLLVVVLGLLLLLRLLRVVRALLLGSTLGRTVLGLRFLVGGVLGPGGSFGMQSSVEIVRSASERGGDIQRVVSVFAFAKQRRLAYGTYSCSAWGSGGGVGRWSPTGWKPFASALYWTL